MSKKDKSKFQRRLRAEILKEMSQSQAEKPAPTTTTQPSIAKVTASPKIEPVKNSTPGVDSQVGASVNTLQLVRSDLKKSAIIIGSIIIVIIIVFLLDNKTGFLLKASDSLFKVLHIGA